MLSPGVSAEEAPDSFVTDQGMEKENPLVATNTFNATIHKPTDDFNYSHCPTIAICRDSFLVAWAGGKENREGGRDQGIVGIESSDFQNWTEPRYLFEPDPGTCLMDPASFVWKDQLYMLFSRNEVDPDKEADDAYMKQGDLLISRLAGESWTSPVVIARTDAPKGQSPSCPVVSNRALVFKRRDGGTRILLPAAFLNNFSGEARPRCLWSDDDAMSWTAGEFVPSDEPKLMEPSVISLGDGRLAMYIRNDYDFPVVWRAFSSDDGETWSSPEPTSIRCWAKTCVVPSLEGGYLMYFNDDPDGVSNNRVAHDNATNSYHESGAPESMPALGPCARRKNLSVAYSSDGISFELAGHLDLGSNGYGISYPSAVEHDGSLYVVSSRRDNMHTRRPNMIRSHRVRMVQQHRRA